MLPGASKRSKYHCPPHENSGGHESQPAVDPFLQQHGFEAAHWSSLGVPSAPDGEIMDHAKAGGYVIFTHDLDFGMLLAIRGSVGPSVVQIRT